MGATNFFTQETGNSIGEAYDNAVEDARSEYGSDAYNGTISTTSGVKDYTSKFKQSGMSIDEFSEKYLDHAQKWGHCIGVCIKGAKKNSNKIQSKVDHIVEKGTKKWELRYVAYEGFGGKQIASERTKGEAVKKARKHTEKTKNRTSVEMVKVLTKGSTRVASVTYKGSSKESVGTYVFFGWASC